MKRLTNNLASSSRRTGFLAACVVAALVPVLVSAHDPNAEPIAEVAIVPSGASVVVTATLPAVALVDANLPRDADGLLTEDGLQEALIVVGRGLAATLELREGDQPLPAPTIEARSADRLSAELTLTYRSSADGRLSARLHPFRARGDIVRTVVSYKAADGTIRPFTIDADHERVEFEPTLGRAVRYFVARGTDGLSAGLFLLFATCLIAPLRSTRVLVTAFSAFAGGQVAASAMTGLGLWAPAVETLLVFQMVAASAIVILAAQGVLAPLSRWLPGTAAIFGIAFGLGLGQQFFDVRSFAGSHTAGGWLAFIVVAVFGQAWIVGLVASLGSVLYRWRVPERWATFLLVALVAHSALHRLSDAGAELTAAGVRSERLVLALAIGWALFGLVAGVVDAARGPVRDAAAHSARWPVGGDVP